MDQSEENKPEESKSEENKPEENKLSNCVVPFKFEGRYFIRESGPVPKFYVVLEHEGKPLFEIRHNEPAENPLTDVSISETGLITVSEKETEKFLYKFQPESETNFIFGKIGGGEISVKISEKGFILNGITLDDCAFNDVSAGVQVDKTGGYQIYVPIPRYLKRMLKS